MQTRKSAIGVRIENPVLLFLAMALFVVLLIRNSGLYPSAFGDEYFYSKLSRLLPLAESTGPCYIFFAIYRLTNICGDGFLVCARILNALFFIAATPFIYRTALRFCARNVASLVTLFALLGPINTYTAYYMPESLYFFSFWLLTWFVLRLDHLSASISWCFGGMLLGLSALVKPHALFILPALAVYVVYVSAKKEGKWMFRAFGNVSAFIVFTFLTRLLIGYLFSDKNGLIVFGGYTASLTGVVSNVRSHQELLALSAKSVMGHMLAVCLMYGVPMAIAMKASFTSMISGPEAKAEQKISFYLLLVLFSLVSAAGFYTASIANANFYETIARLHMRYYNFVFPLFLIIAASQFSSESTAGMRKGRAIAAFPVGAAILYVVYSRLAHYAPHYLDSPELYGFAVNPIVFYALSGISLVSLVVWVYVARVGAKIFIYLLMPLAVIFTAFYANQELRKHLVPDMFDRAGIFTKHYLPSEDLSKLIVVGSDPAGLYRSLFHIDNPQASFEMIPEGSAYDLSRLPVGKEWALVVGDHSLPENTFYQLPMCGFTLASSTGSNIVDFKRSGWPGVISKTQGLSYAEAWGTWSVGDAVILEFSKPLPEKFTVHLYGGAFGPNVGKEFVAHVGDSAVRFTLKIPHEERELHFNNPNKSRTIKIDIPSPVSPEELGLGDDDRRIGLALGELKIDPL